MRITAIEPQARHANRFNLYLDDQFALGVSAMLAAKLRVGQTLTDAELTALEREETFESAHEKALRFLEPRPRSSVEVKQHLAKKKIAGDTAARVVERLIGAGLVDDAAFARYWVENREEFRPRSSRALKFELKRKGVAATAISDALGAIDESESAYRAGVAKATRWSGLELREFREKMIAFLARRGFAYGIAKEATARLWKETREEGAEE